MEVGRFATTDAKITTSHGGAIASVQAADHHSVNLKYVKLGYHYLKYHLLTLCLTPLTIAVIIELAMQTNPNVLGHLLTWLDSNSQFYNPIITCSSLLIFGSALYALTRTRPVYLVDFSCHRPPDRLKVSRRLFTERTRLAGCFDESSLEFQRRIIERSGLGDETYLPEAMHSVPPAPASMAAAREESELVICGVLDDLFAKTRVKPKDVGILVVNSSLFNPTPSLSAMIVNRYKLRSNVRSFNLGGMGCSAGLIAVDLAGDLLRLHRNTYAVVVSTENITRNSYRGTKKSMLIPNCLFRVGGSALLLSNQPSDRQRSKYKLLHVVRTHKGADDRAYWSVYQDEDGEGKTGISLSKDLMAVASGALKTNITALGPLVLPLREKLLFFFKVVSFRKKYVPNFRSGIDHFCIHAGGRAVIDELERALGLREGDVEASRMTLHRFGNTSSSSIWYEVAYVEAKRRVRRGNRVWQIAFGSGFKCNSAVWEATRDIVEGNGGGPWEDCIERYPMEIV